ncbi:MAG: glycosyltransferase family 4 protein [Actinomycetota bacterium]
MSRILLVGKGSPERGGISSFLTTLLESDLKRAHDLSFLNLSSDRAPRAGRLSASNIRRTLLDTRALWRNAAGCDLVHIHSALAPGVTLARAGLLTLAARLRRCRVVVHAHGGMVQLWLITPARRLLARIALAPTDRVVAVSEGGLAALGAVLSPARMSLIDNGVDMSAYAPDPRSRIAPANDPPRILYAGPITPRKGLLDLLEASSLLRERGACHEILLAGGTPAEGPEAEAEVHAAAGRQVRFLGPRPHEAMPGLYRSVDLYCLPSWWEAMPLSVLEAMASGLPVVASRVGDIPRAVCDGVTGRVVPPRDPRALAEALEPLVVNPELRRRYGEAGRRRAERHFDLAATIAALDDLYRDLAG